MATRRWAEAPSVPLDRGRTLILARRYGAPLRHAWLPPLMVDTIATFSFATAGAWLAGMAVDTFVVDSGQGAGQWLGAAPVALLAALLFGLRLLRRLRSPALATAAV